jgi:hypothetical protein
MSGDRLFPQETPALPTLGKPDPTATWIAEVSRQAVALTDYSAIELIELYADALPDGWLDVRPLVDEREVRVPTLDIHRAYLAYADLRRLITRHPVHPHLVLITRRP